jgi:hypothetical protein
MSTDRLPYHLSDEDLLQVFLRGIPHKILLEPIRRSETLRNKYFRGYRVTERFPEKQVISKAYSKELRLAEDQKLTRFLFANWVYEHQDLSQKALATMDIVFPEEDWLEHAHDYLRQHGHKATAKMIIRTLAIAYPPPNIHIFISIISQHYEAQSELRQFVEEEIRLTQSNPHVLRDHLQNQLNSIASKSNSLKQSIEDIEVSKQNRNSIVEQQTSALREELRRAQNELRDSETQVSAARQELEALNERIRKQTGITSGLKQKKEKLEGQIDHIQVRFREDSNAERVKLSKLQTDLDAAAEEEKRVQDQIATLEARIRQENESIELAKQSEKQDKEVVSEKNQEILDATADDKTLTTIEWTTTFVDDLYKSLSFSSCVTLDLIWLRCSGLVDVKSEREKPQGDYVAESLGWRNYFAYRSVASGKGWDRADLAWYAWVRTLIPRKDSREVLLDFVVSGLYHAARSNDDEITDLLISRLLELSSGTSAVNQIAVDLPEVAVKIIEDYANDPEALRFFGLVQSKLASASPRALIRLYDRLPPKARIIAKRSLVAHLAEFDLDEQDPGHEMIDVICTTIESNITPFVGSFRSWCKRATLQTILNDRQTLLRVAHKSVDTFSTESLRRLNLFRQLFGKELTDATAQGTPESYAALKRRCLEFLDSELRSPEWVS